MCSMRKAVLLSIDTTNDPYLTDAFAIKYCCENFETVLDYLRYWYHGYEITVAQYLSNNFEIVQYSRCRQQSMFLVCTAVIQQCYKYNYFGKLINIVQIKTRFINRLSPALL